MVGQWQSPFASDCGRREMTAEGQEAMEHAWSSPGRVQVDTTSNQASMHVKVRPWPEKWNDRQQAAAAAPESAHKPTVGHEQSRGASVIAGQTQSSPTPVVVSSSVSQDAPGKQQECTQKYHVWGMNWCNISNDIVSVTQDQLHQFIDDVRDAAPMPQSLHHMSIERSVRCIQFVLMRSILT